ncbi:MAG: hypothetical protein WC647_04665 [Desulfomonilaceae bacterium]
MPERGDLRSPPRKVEILVPLGWRNAVPLNRLFEPALRFIEPAKAENSSVGAHDSGSDDPACGGCRIVISV